MKETTSTVEELRREAHAAYREAERAFCDAREDSEDPHYVASMERVTATLAALGVEA